MEVKTCSSRKTVKEELKAILASLEESFNTLRNEKMSDKDWANMTTDRSKAHHVLIVLYPDQTGTWYMKEKLVQKGICKNL